jgi:hypothetical protein
MKYPLKYSREQEYRNYDKHSSYRLFSGHIAYFCNANVPTNPALSQEWNGVAGVTGTSGIIEVTQRQTDHSSIRSY